ncbi:MAG: hypothetical protein H0X33_13845 [Taibaiella sp.]|nr:hypothetical protein [Taibaiella sp.]
MKIRIMASAGLVVLFALGMSTNASAQWGRHGYGPHVSVQIGGYGAPAPYYAPPAPCYSGYAAPTPYYGDGYYAPRRYAYAAPVYRGYAYGNRGGYDRDGGRGYGRGYDRDGGRGYARGGGYSRGGGYARGGGYGRGGGHR